MKASGQLTTLGFEILDSVIPQEECDALAVELSALHDQQKKLTGHRRGGLRNLLQTVPKVSELASSNQFRSILEERLEKKIFPVRALYFDKSPDANWSVVWHQDLAIPVAEKVETPGYAAWSVKEGVVHVQPPATVLEGMAVIRLHLDDCGADNGALKVIPRSHLSGKLNDVEVNDRTHQESAVVCEVPKGGAVLMRPLLLHASAPAKQPTHRRVLHIEYASTELANGLKWFGR
jgi:hypothetical protein